MSTRFGRSENKPEKMRKITFTNHIPQQVIKPEAESLALPTLFGFFICWGFYIYSYERSESV